MTSDKDEATDLALDVMLRVHGRVATENRVGLAWRRQSRRLNQTQVSAAWTNGAKGGRPRNRIMLYARAFCLLPEPPSLGRFLWVGHREQAGRETEPLDLLELVIALPIVSGTVRATSGRLKQGRD